MGTRSRKLYFDNVMRHNAKNDRHC